MELLPGLKQALEAHKGPMLAFGQELIAIATENPPGRHYRAGIERIGRELERLGFPVQITETPGGAEYPRYNLLAFHGEGERTLYFHGHYDVVPADTPKQFKPEIKDGWLLGRGAADMKAGLAAMIYAVYLLRELEVPLRGRIGLCIVADEETGGEGGSAYLDRAGLLGKLGIGMFTPEPTSGVIWNANRGAISLRITVEGKAAHVGLQHQGINAFEQMVEVVKALRQLKAEVEGRRTAFHITPQAAARSILMIGGQVQGGTNFNVVPERCSFTVDRRINPEEDLNVERTRLLALFDGLKRQGIRLEVEVLQEGQSSGVSERDPIALALADSAEMVMGKRPRFEMCPGLLEIRWYARQGIPAFAYGPGNLELAHGPNEAVELEGVYRHTLVYALAAARILA